MACRDRTRDFTLAIRTLQPHQNGLVDSKESFKKDLSHSTGFMPVAKQLSKDISNTFAKLEKLTMLASKKSLFDDNNDQIQQLTFVIKQDINTLNKQIVDLQQISTGGPQKSSKSHSSSIVLALQSHLANMSRNFKSVLEVRTKNMKEQRTRREQYSSTPLMPPSRQNGHAKSVLMQDSQVSLNMEALDNHHHHDNHHDNQQQQQLALIDQQDAYIQSRADTMVNVEQTIVELGAIFQQLATMVHEQEDVVHRIDSHIDESSLNIDAAHTELVKYFKSVTNNRWLMMKIFAILIVFFILFIIFLA